MRKYNDDLVLEEATTPANNDESIKKKLKMLFATVCDYIWRALSKFEKDVEKTCKIAEETDKAVNPVRSQSPWSYFEAAPATPVHPQQTIQPGFPGFAPAGPYKGSLLAQSGMANGMVYSPQGKNGKEGAKEHSSRERSRESTRSGSSRSCQNAPRVSPNRNKGEREKFVSKSAIRAIPVSSVMNPDNQPQIINTGNWVQNQNNYNGTFGNKDRGGGRGPFICSFL